LLVDNRAVDFEMAVESNAWAHAAQQSLEGGFTRLDRLAPQILAIKVKVEIAKRYGSIVLTSADHLEHGEAIVVAGDCRNHRV
jgi:hypothetical protein